jgi:hypothetical protein
LFGSKFAYRTIRSYLLFKTQNGEKHGDGGKEADSVLSSPDENLFSYLKITYFQRGHLLVCQSAAALERITL